MTETTMQNSQYFVWNWTNPNPMPPCGKKCPFYWIWEEDND